RPWSDPCPRPASRAGPTRPSMHPGPTPTPVRPDTHVDSPDIDRCRSVSGESTRIVGVSPCSRARPPSSGPAGRTLRPREPRRTLRPCRPRLRPSGPAGHASAPAARSAEAARDVVLGLLVRGVGEDGVGVVDLDEVAGLAGAGDVEEP